MQVDIQVLTESGEPALNSLFRWLSRDADVRRNVSVSLSTAGAEGAMGTADVINVILTEATNIASLVVAIASWRDSRAEPPPVQLTIGDNSVVIINNSIDEITDKLRLLSDAPHQDGGSW